MIKMNERKARKYDRSHSKRTTWLVSLRLSENNYTLSMESIISSVFLVLEEIQRTRLLCILAVVVIAQQIHVLPIGRILATVARGKRQHQGEPLVWYQVEFSSIQETSTVVRA